MESPLIAVVDDDPGQRQLLDRALRSAGYETRCFETGEQALEGYAGCELMLLDVRLPGISGLEVLEHLSVEEPDLPIILCTAYIDLRDAVTAIKQGALDYLQKPLDLDEVIAAVDDALDRTGRAVSIDGDALVLPPYVIAESPAMRDVFRQAARVAASDIAVLITGESGVGKDVVATFIHESSGCAQGPFVRVNCGALPEQLIESELFGHERGAFTGADARRIGRFEEASGGTLFLDEIGELPLALQPKLLHVLEGGIVRRVGGSGDIRVDVRVIAATNRDLEQQVEEGKFREDLFYRLNVVGLTVPPLRERPDDILPLAEALRPEDRARLAPATQRILMSYDWPGNVRELRNAVERAAIMAHGELILPRDLPPKLQRIPEKPPAAQGVLVGDMKEIQRRAILEALEKTGGNKTRAAEVLGISRRNLIYKLREYGL